MLRSISPLPTSSYACRMRAVKAGRKFIASTPTMCQSTTRRWPQWCETSRSTCRITSLYGPVSGSPAWGKTTCVWRLKLWHTTLKGQRKRRRAMRDQAIM